MSAASIPDEALPALLPMAASRVLVELCRACEANVLADRFNGALLMYLHDAAVVALGGRVLIETSYPGVTVIEQEVVHETDPGA